MRAQLQVVEQQAPTAWIIIIVAVMVLASVTHLPAQTKNGFRMKTSRDSSQVSAASDEGVPERGRFEFVYSYSGEAISPDIAISVNGSQIAGLGSLAPVTNDTLVARPVAKGDKVNLFASFGIAEATVFLHTGLAGYPPGFWAGTGSITFYQFDPADGSIIKVFGTMSYEYYHTPPWNGIEVTAGPENLMAGEASAITLQPYETPAEPVIIPDQTYINLETSFLGDLIGGLSLPEFGFRYRKGFSNAPWGGLKDTDILYEVHPSIETSDPLGIPIVAYSPYDLSKSGSAVVEVGEEEEELVIKYIDTEEIELWPTLPGFTYSGRNQNENNLRKEILVEVTRDGEPVPNKEVVVLPRYISETGGHDHPGSPPKSLRGEIIFLDDPITDSDGRVEFTYQAPKISGEYELIAQVAEDGTIYEDIKSTIIKVPDLDPLVDSPYFEKVGAPNNNKTTNDPCRPQTSLKSKHFSNHYGTNNLNTAIRKITRKYYQDSEGIKLRVNDMSLTWGGIFDIDNDWTKPHKEHRIGEQADIGAKGILKSGECSKSLDKTNLLRLMGQTTDFPTYIHYETDEENETKIVNHYHIRVR